jgi:hypothetical protein
MSCVPRLRLWPNGNPRFKRKCWGFETFCFANHIQPADFSI